MNRSPQNLNLLQYQVYWNQTFWDVPFKISMRSRLHTQTDGLNASHIIILGHTAVSAGKHWAWIKQAARRRFNGPDLMWAILSQSEQDNIDALTIYANH